MGSTNTKEFVLSSEKYPPLFMLYQLSSQNVVARDPIFSFFHANPLY